MFKRWSIRYDPCCEMMEDRLMLSALPAHIPPAPASVMARPKPSPPFLATAISPTQVNLSWLKIQGASKYLIEEMVGNQWVQLGVVKPRLHSDAITGLNPDTTYTFDVVYIKGGRQHREVARSATTLIPTSPWTIDHPAAIGTYEVFNAPLFGPNGPLYTDVNGQSDTGVYSNDTVYDGWMMVSMAEAAARDPQLIERMFTDLGPYMENGVQVHLWSVRLYSPTGSGAAVSVIVDNELPANSQGKAVYDQPHGNLWAALVEKAYVQANIKANDYAELDGGLASWSLQAITGRHAQSSDIISPSGIDAALRSGCLVVIDSSMTPADSRIIPNICYAVVADTVTGNMPYTVYNPADDSGATYDGHSVFGSTFYCNASYMTDNFWGQDWIVTD